MADDKYPAWHRGWWHGARFVEHHGFRDRDDISQLPDGSFLADLSDGQGGFLRHGPLATIDQARACSLGRCDCRQRTNELAQRRRALETAANRQGIAP